LETELDAYPSYPSPMTREDCVGVSDELAGRAVDLTA
jgi:hypothetical protein